MSRGKKHAPVTGTIVIVAIDDSGAVSTLDNQVIAKLSRRRMEEVRRKLRDLAQELPVIWETHKQLSRRGEVQP